MRLLIRQLTRRRFRSDNRRGNILVLSAALMVMVFAFVAFSIDVGFISLTRAGYGTAEAPGVAAAQQLSGIDDATVANAREAALDVVIANVNGNAANANFVPEQDVVFGRSVWNAQTQSLQYRGATSIPPITSSRCSRSASCDRPTPSPARCSTTLPLFFVTGDRRGRRRALPRTPSPVSSREISSSFWISRTRCATTACFTGWTCWASRSIETSLRKSGRIWARPPTGTWRSRRASLRITAWLSLAAFRTSMSPGRGHRSP